MEKINLLINNIPYYTFNGEVIYDSLIEDMTRGILTYLSDGNESDLFNFCDINEYKSNLDVKYFFILSTHMLHWDTMGDLLLFDNVFGKLLRNVLSNKNIKCVFVDAHESDDLNHLSRLSRIINKLKFNKNDIWILNNDSKLEEYNSIKKLGFNVKKLNYLTTFTHENFYDDYESIKKSKKDKFFICVNKRAKIHRISTLAYLKKYNLLNKTNYSLLETNEEEDSDFNRFLGDSDYSNITNEIEFILFNSPKQTDYESINNTDLLNTSKYMYAGIIDLEDYIQPCVNIVTESMYETNSVHITEKSFKPFALCLLPIIVATPHHIKLMESYYGFDFFHDIINHSYDLELNHKIRLKMIIEEVNRLYLNQDNVIEFYNSNKDRILRNRNILKQICNEKWDSSFFTKTILCK